jgi:hypothetical protein
MLLELKEASTSPLQPQLVLSDFERSAMNAYEEEFPGIVIKGCHFHMTQSLWRKIQELGLAVDYKENSQLRAWFDLFKGLAFVPLNLIELAFNIILDSKPLKNEKIDLFIKYFTSTWFSSSCMFPPHIWNHY